MGELGSIYDGMSSSGPRGPDLRATVEVAREQLGETQYITLPTQLEHQGQLVDRVLVDGDPSIPLHLGPEFKSGATLRLRGQGGRHDGQRAGDLYLQVHVVEHISTAPTLPDRLPIVVSDPMWWILGGLGLTALSALSWLIA